MRKNRVTSLLLSVILILISLSGCGKKSDRKIRNITQIQRESGIPVKVEEAKYEPFNISLGYNVNLSGIKETTLNSMLADRVDKVNVKVGDYVETDQILISFPENTPGAQYQQAKAAFENATQTYDRMSNLYEQGGISKQDLDQLNTAKVVAEANFKAVEKMVHIRAPYQGYVTQINYKETESVNPGSPLITIAQINKYKTKVWVSENDIFSVKLGLNATARWQDVELSGKVVQVARSIDRDQQAFAVDLEFDNPNKLMLSGVMASVELFTYENKNAIVIQRQFLQNDNGDSYVYVVQDSRAVKRYVKLGKSNRITSEIIEGIELDDMIIKEGVNLVNENNLVRVIE
ncbi:MAG: efflux RND transporter periplasmic adaptor subunit [Candidatus Cloacimonas sp.]